MKTALGNTSLTKLLRDGAVKVTVDPTPHGLGACVVLGRGT
jgi:hypothetical protein